jgi:hypothetical protein
VDEDVSLEVRNSRSRIIPYLMEAERRDIRNGKLVINERSYELDCLLKKMQWNKKNSSVDTPAEQRMHYLEDTGQQISENGRCSYSEKRTQRTEGVTRSRGDF